MRNVARALWDKLTKEWKKCMDEGDVFDHVSWAEMNISIAAYQQKHAALEATTVISWDASWPAQTVGFYRIVIRFGGLSGR